MVCAVFVYGYACFEIDPLPLTMTSDYYCNRKQNLWIKILSLSNCENIRNEKFKCIKELSVRVIISII